TVHQTPDGKVAYSKGASEIILASCTHILADEAEGELSSDTKQEILNRAQAMANGALRVLGVAYRRISENETVGPQIEQNMVFLGLVGMIDPPREEVKDAIKLCNDAGIKSVMITGDHKLTAVAIARELGLMKKGVAVSGVDVDSFKENEFDELVEKIEVYARVSPAHKLRVVEALVKKGHVVAMTGDGVNDAPALKKADIGIAMGITGTDVSKESANMVLTDDNFASIVAAVGEGRVIFSNIKKYLVYILSCNLGEVSLMAICLLFGPLLGIPPGVFPLLAIQILYVNLATDGFPAIALSVEPAESGIMRQKPRKRHGSIFTGPVLFYIIFTGLCRAVVCTTIFLWALRAGRAPSEAQCLCFVTLILLEFFNALNCRSLSRSLFAIGPFTNKWLIIAIAWECILLAAIVYLPFLQKPLNTYPLNLAEWGIVIGAASTLFILVELTKMFVYIFRKRETSE
ncbi:MAG: cation-transporting P-type ATPase, partial [Planctomycetota bacterium]